MSRERWRIEQLQSVVEAALAAAAVADPGSKRVRAVPDTRTIRYYTTLGLLDRPAEMRGRTAFYSRRHALQLVCVKRLQSTGMSLSDVQHRLAGASDAQLRSTARVPKEFWESCEQFAQHEATAAETASGSREVHTSSSRSASSRSASFWKATSVSPTDTVVAEPQVRVRLPLGADIVLEIPGDAQSVAAALPQLAPLIEPLVDKLTQLGFAINDADMDEHRKVRTSPPPDTEQETS